MQLTIPQIISGIITFFIAMLGFRIFSPLIYTFMGLSWKSTFTQYSVYVIVYLIFFFIIYVVVYGTITNKVPQILNTNNGGTQ